MAYWNVYLGGAFLGRVRAWAPWGAMRAARQTWGEGLAYHVTRSSEVK